MLSVGTLRLLKSMLDAQQVHMGHPGARETAAAIFVAQDELALALIAAEMHPSEERAP